MTQRIYQSVLESQLPHTTVSLICEREKRVEALIIVALPCGLGLGLGLRDCGLGLGLGLRVCGLGLVLGLRDCGLGLGSGLRNYG